MRFCCGIYCMDTESTTEGYLSAFMAKRFDSRLIPKYPSGNNSSPTFRRRIAELDSIIHTLPDVFRCTQQQEVKNFFDTMNEAAFRAEAQIRKIKPKLKKIDCYYRVLFANVGWDLDVIKGIVFTDREMEVDGLGDSADIVRFTYGKIHFEDFLKLTGFRSIKMAGMVCTHAHKLDGTEVYSLSIKDVPEHFEDYPEAQKQYMINDVEVMTESLNIIINRKENQTIIYDVDMPMTATGFGRWRMLHNPEVISFDGLCHQTQKEINLLRWKYARPWLLYLMSCYKGGLCGPNPHIQYKLLRNYVCFDARSMYPHKMLFFKMMQCTSKTRVHHCEEEPEEEQRLIDNIFLNFRLGFNRKGLWTHKPEDPQKGVFPWNGLVTLKIKEVRNRDNVWMLPFLSEHKISAKTGKIITSNGKILQTQDRIDLLTGEVFEEGTVTMFLSSVDLLLTMLCYRVEILRIHHWINLTWRPMLAVQKRDVWEAYKRKMDISGVKGQKEEYREYWEESAGFNFERLMELSEEEYKQFYKSYKMLIKADVNGKYGLTVEKPIHPKTEIIWEDGLPVWKTETIPEMMERVRKDPDDPNNVPRWVKANDYAAGSSITMWSRWQLVTLMFFLYRNGIEVAYCDTDSEFIPDTKESRDLVEEYNRHMSESYHETNLSSDEVLTIEDADMIGMMEEDKLIRIFRTLGAKCYAYVGKDDKINVTVAGLRAKEYEKIMNRKIESGADPYDVLMECFRPNLIIQPEVVQKLVKDEKNMKYDSDGKWIGPVLEKVGFCLINYWSKFHCNNGLQAALLQGKPKDYYIGRFNSFVYLGEDGFTDGENISKDKMMDRIEDIGYIKEDEIPIQYGEDDINYER